MANRDAPFGFRPSFHLTGGVIRPQKYHIADALANHIGYGDPVFLVDSATGREARDIDLADTANTDEPVVGVFAGCEYRDTSGNVVFARRWVSATSTLNSDGATAYVYDDPFIVYEIQGDGTHSGGTNGEGAIGLSANVAFTASDSVSGMSRAELDTSDIGATSQLLYIYDYKRDVENDPSLANPVYLVLFNLHAYRTAGAQSFDLLSA